jgi:hypothetical protein
VFIGDWIKRHPMRRVPAAVAADSPFARKRAFVTAMANSLRRLKQRPFLVS